MNVVMSVSLPVDIATRVDERVRERGIKRSALIREAVEAMLAAEQRNEPKDVHQ